MAFAVVAVLTGCGGGSGGHGRGAASEPAASVTPGPPPEKLTLAQLDASKIPVRGAPDWMADDGRNLFVKTDSGSVAVIDPNKSTEVRKPSLGAGGLCQGIAADSGMVWSCDPNPSGTTDDVLRVNSKSGKAQRFEVGKRPDQGHLDVAAGRAWVITDAGLVGLNVTTGQPDPPIDLEVPGTDIAATDERAYVVSRGAGAVVSVDLTGRRVSRSPLSVMLAQSQSPTRFGWSRAVSWLRWRRKDSRRPRVSRSRKHALSLWTGTASSSSVPSPC